MAMDVQLVVANVSLGDDDLWADGYWASVCNLVTLEVYVDDGEDPVEKISDTVERAVAATPRLRVERVFEEEVTSYQIAARVGVAEKVVLEWVGEESFPAESQNLFTRDIREHQIWRWADVVRWLAENKKFTIEDYAYLPDRVTVTKVDAWLAGKNAEADSASTGFR